MKKRATREQSKHVAVKRSTADVLDDLCLQYSRAIGNGEVKRWQLIDIMLKSCVIECIECANPVFVFSPTCIECGCLNRFRPDNKLMMELIRNTSKFRQYVRR
jgi:hypothetical protein